MSGKHWVETSGVFFVFFQYVPYIIVSLFAGTFVDRHSKKKIMLASDSIAAFCSLGILLLNTGNELKIGYIYIVNFVIGFMNAFQGPAADVAIGKMVPEDKLATVSGMNSFSENLNIVMAPVFAASLFAFGGLKFILWIDLFSFFVAFLVLLFVITIPHDEPEMTQTEEVFSGCVEGFSYLKSNGGFAHERWQKCNILVNSRRDGESADSFCDCRTAPGFV